MLNSQHIHPTPRRDREDGEEHNIVQNTNHSFSSSSFSSEPIMSPARSGNWRLPEKQEQKYNNTNTNNPSSSSSSESFSGNSMSLIDSS